jgi:hypothetical protein
MRGRLEVYELDGPRFALALERFQGGDAFSFQGVGFSINVRGGLECEVASSWQPENVTEATAESDLTRSEMVLAQLLRSSPAFAAAIAGRTVTHVLVDDYDIGTVELCRKTPEGTAWAPGFPTGGS